MANSNCLLRWVIVLATFFLGVVFARNLSVNDDALDLLPDGSVREDLELLQRIGLVNRLFITLSADDQVYLSDEAALSALKKSAEKLGDLMRANDHFSNVLTRFPAGCELQLYTSLQPYLPVLLDAADLAEIEQRITPAGIRQAMHDNFVQLNTPAGMGMKKLIQQDPLGFMHILFAKLVHLQSEYSMRLDDGFFVSPDRKNFLVMAESTRSLTDSNNAQIIQAELEQIYHAALMPGIAARVIGTLPHTLANSQSIKHDLRVLLPAATVLLILLLGVTLRDARAFVVFGVPFLGAPPAIAVTSWVFGGVSALALGFGIVILGIAVDFSVHLFLTLRTDDRQREALRRVRKPILFATMTTASVLCVLFFSAVPSHRQMATLALAGVIFAVIFAWLLIPTIAPVSKTPNRGETLKKDLPGWCVSPVGGRWLLLPWLLLLLFGLLAWPQLQYNGDLRVLDAPNPQVLADEQHFTTVWGSNSDQAFIVSAGDNMAQALNANGRVFRFLQEHHFQILQSLAPLLPGPDFQQRNTRTWSSFWAARRPAFDRNFAEAAREQGFSDQAFAPFFQALGRDPGLFLPEDLTGSALGSMVSAMVRQQASVPDEREQNRVLVLTTVALTDANLPVLQAFAGTDPAVSVLANRKWRSEAERLLQKDIVALSAMAGCIVVLLVTLQFGNGRAIVAVLAPVLSALAAMSVFCWLTGRELNMMHLIMGIMVIGLSVDYGIFIVCSRLQERAGATYLAVSVCAASSLIGFGVLAFAAHPALNSLGVTVLVGIGVAWPVALAVSPHLLQGQRKRLV